MQNLEINIIDLPKITDTRGNLTFAEGLDKVPFEIKRAYWVYDVPGGESRGGHAHKKLRQFVVALSGSFHVTLDNGYELVLASEHYEAEDYIEDYDEFLKYVGCSK